MKLAFIALNLAFLFAQGYASYIPKIDDDVIHIKAGNKVHSGRTRPFNPSVEAMEKFTTCLQTKNNAMNGNMGGKEFVPHDVRAAIYRKCLEYTIPQIPKITKEGNSRWFSDNKRYCCTQNLNIWELASPLSKKWSFQQLRIFH